METYNVLIYPIAQNDLRDIVEYLNTLSPQSAFEYYDLIIERITELQHFPKRYPYARDSQLRLKGYRFFMVKSYIIFYCIIGNEVQIRRILYGKRNYNDLLR